MNPLETFGEFSSKLTTTDLMLYAGVAIVLWVLFKDKLGGVQKFIGGLLGKAEDAAKSVVSSNSTKKDEDVFFALVSSWKSMRDLAVKSGCDKAVEAADQMFQYLSPITCAEKKDESATLNK